jgi:hypothetical protein
MFSHWVDENNQQLSTQNPFTVKMTANKTVKAVKIHLRKEKILRMKTLFIPKK